MSRAATHSRGGIAPRLLVLGGATLWGTTGTTQALAPAGASAATVGAVRLLLGALALAALALALRGLNDVRAFARPGVRAATLAAIVAMAAYQLCFFAGVARAGVAVGTIVGIGSAPVFTGVLALLVHGERPERSWGVATVLAVAGAALLVGAGAGTGDGAGGGRVETLGVVLALGAGAAYAAYTVASKILLDAGRTPSGTMAVTFAGGALLLLPLLVVGDAGWVLQPRGLAAALWLGVATVGVAYLMFATGLRALPAATVATLTLAEPLTAGTLGVAVLGERPGPLAAAGVALVAAGLVLLVARPRAPGGATRGAGRGSVG